MHIKVINGHVEIRMYSNSFKVTCDHLHGPLLKWNYNCIYQYVPVIGSTTLLGLLLTGTCFRFPLGVPVIRSLLYL